MSSVRERPRPQQQVGPQVQPRPHLRQVHRCLRRANPQREEHEAAQVDEEAAVAVAELTLPRQLRLVPYHVFPMASQI
jgi:hypothetical protein